MQGSINNHIDLLKAIFSANEAKEYDEALSKLLKSDNAVVQHVKKIHEDLKDLKDSSAEQI
jgi:hypothetical protein